MGIFFQFESVDAFTSAAVGQPGQRTFYLQVRDGETRITVKCEKQQAASIAEFLRKVMIDLPIPSDRPLSGTLNLVEPVQAVFVLGPIGLGYDRENDRLLVQLEEFVPTNAEGEADEDAVEDRGHIRLFLQRGQALAFCERTEVVVASGRAPCVFCTRPLDPDGHLCPKMN